MCKNNAAGRDKKLKCSSRKAIRKNLMTWMDDFVIRHASDEELVAVQTVVGY